MKSITSNIYLALVSLNLLRTLHACVISGAWFRKHLRRTFNVIDACVRRLFLPCGHGRDAANGKYRTGSSPRRKGTFLCVNETSGSTPGKIVAPLILRGESAVGAPRDRRAGYSGVVYGPGKHPHIGDKNEILVL